MQVSSLQIYKSNVLRLKPSLEASVSLCCCSGEHWNHWMFELKCRGIKRVVDTLKEWRSLNWVTPRRTKPPNPSNMTAGLHGPACFSCITHIANYAAERFINCRASVSHGAVYILHLKLEDSNKSSNKSLPISNVVLILLIQTPLTWFIFVKKKKKKKSS